VRFHFTQTEHLHSVATTKYPDEVEEVKKENKENSWEEERFSEGPESNIHSSDFDERERLSFDGEEELKQAK
jgi:hypothetical protein